MAFEWADKVDGGDIVDIVVVNNRLTVENLTLCADIIDGSLITVN